ncbi:MAG TPA: hypothetical protein VFV70_06535, partial [Hyphomonadaceae bacterium]|nr:hypothetical protein [Hyphomonadaceae bacterium]
SGKLPPHTPGAGPVIDPLLDREPVRAAEPEAAHDPLFDPAAVRPSDRATEWKTRTEPLFEIAPARPVEADAKLDPLFDPEPSAEEPSPRPVATEPAARSAAAKPVATSMPPMAMAFPSTATLSPIPRSSDPPPHLVAPPSSASIESSAAMHLSTVAPSPAPAVEQFSDPAFADIRAAIKDGRLEDADRLLNASRETATGLALAELTGLAGDHAAAAGRQSNAKWLWRLALKRFGEAGAIDSPAARQVSERLRLAGQ